MQDKIISTEYKISIGFKRSWIFGKKKIKYSLYKIQEVEVWDDPSYGNGGGAYGCLFTRKTLINRFDTFIEAEQLKTEYEKLIKI